jgi:hypothetical protein
MKELDAFSGIIGIRREGALDKALGRISRSSPDRAAFPSFRKTHRGYPDPSGDARIEEGNLR